MAAMKASRPARHPVSELCAAGRLHAVRGPSTGNPAPQAKPPPQTPVSKVDRLAVHQRAATHDALNSPCFALPDRVLGDAAVTEGAVKPHLAHPTLGALADQLHRDGRVRRHHDAIDGSGDRTKIRIASCALGFGGVRVDREHLMREPTAGPSAPARVRCCLPPHPRCPRVI